MKKFNSVMVIDDDDTSNFICEMLVRKSNISENLYLMKNGKEAIDFINENCRSTQNRNMEKMCPDLIFLDLNMPVMDGLEFLAEIYSNTAINIKQTKIYMLTSSENPEDINKVIKYNVQGYINKPMTDDKLVELLSTI
jgi:CheY-like chemotaxis protein